MLDVEAVYAEWRLTVLRFLNQRVSPSDRDLVDDLAQEVWLRVHRFAHSYTDEHGAMKGWLLTIARNVLIDHARRKQAKTIGTHLNVSAEMLAELGHEVEQPERPAEGAAHVETREDLERAISALPEKQGAVIRSRYLTGYSVRETSEAVGVSEEGVKKLQARGLRGLRRLLEAA